MIPAEAVEAAAEWLPHSDDCEVRPERYCTCWQPRINIMRAALEAAAPYMLASAWEEGMQAMYDTTSSEWPPIPDQNPYRPTA